MTLAHMPETAIMPTGAASVIAAIEELKTVRSFVQSQLVSGVDYGKIPGCGDKPTLFLPGAQKMGAMMNVRPAYMIKEKQLIDSHIEYRVKTKLIHRLTGHEVSQGIGSCSTAEKKYRRTGGIVCPKCDKPCIMKDKKSNGYYCFSAKGGCGANFKAGDPTLNLDKTGTDPYDVYELTNTVLKMAKKRSFVDGIITFGCLSQLFTQDIEDTYTDEDYAQAQAQLHDPEQEAKDGVVPRASAQQLVAYGLYMDSVIVDANAWWMDNLGDRAPAGLLDGLSDHLISVEREEGRLADPGELTRSTRNSIAAAIYARSKSVSDETIMNEAAKRFKAAKKVAPKPEMKADEQVIDVTPDDAPGEAPAFDDPDGPVDWHIPTVQDIRAYTDWRDEWIRAKNVTWQEAVKKQLPATVEFIKLPKSHQEFMSQFQVSGHLKKWAANFDGFPRMHENASDTEVAATAYAITSEGVQGEALRYARDNWKEKLAVVLKALAKKGEMAP